MSKYKNKSISIKDILKNYTITMEDYNKIKDDQKLEIVNTYC